MAMLRAAVLLALLSTACSQEVRRCHDCFTSTPHSACHVRPAQETVGTKTDCLRGTKRCVTERQQDSEGNMISLRRRCANKRESRFSYNRCEERKDGTTSCLSYCHGALCNTGPGRLYTATRYFNYGSPDYADYSFDPDQAVLDPGYNAEARHQAHVQDQQGQYGLGNNSAARSGVGLGLVVGVMMVRVAGGDVY